MTQTNAIFARYKKKNRKHKMTSDALLPLYKTNHSTAPATITTTLYNKDIQQRNKKRRELEYKIIHQSIAERPLYTFEMHKYIKDHHHEW